MKTIVNYSLEDNFGVDVERKLQILNFNLIHTVKFNNAITSHLL